MKTNELTEVEVKGGMSSHLALETEHILKYEYTIITPDAFENKRIFYSETITKKRKGSYGKFGKSETVYYFEPDGKMFTTGIELLESIGLKLKDKDERKD